MSPRAPRVCAEPGCPKPAWHPHNKCETHRLEHNRQADKRRPNAGQRGYGAKWRQVRAHFLRANPTCVDCGAASTDADHAPVSRRALLAAGVADPDQPQYLEARCRSCHARKTARHDGSFGRETRP